MTQTQVAPPVRKQTKVKAKTYVLLPHTRPNAEHIHIQVTPEKRTKIGAKKLDMPFMRIGFVDQNGDNRNIRFKLNCESIELSEQMTKGIGANEKFTQREYDTLKFRHGVLTTLNPVAQKYLDTTPQNVAVWNTEGVYCDEVVQPLFEEYNPSIQRNILNAEIKKRAEAVTRIFNLELEEIQDLMVRINGSHFTPPSDIMDCQNMMVDWIDNTDDAGLDAILREEDTADENATIIVSKAIKHNIISFKEVPGQVVKITGGTKLKLKEVPDDISEHDKQRYFIEYLLSDSGKPLFDDLAKAVEKADKKEKISK